MGSLISRANLELSWRRITTGRNLQYKKYFRTLYTAYEPALRSNLEDLHERLRGGSYRPQRATKIYLPKASGLQRPITLLSLEDQIVLQAIANICAVRVRKERNPLELASVFSSILTDRPRDIFFLRDWRETYAEFTTTVKSFYAKGYRWIAEFDLAAFYDTVSHDLLVKTVFPRTRDRLTDTILEFLKSWSSESPPSAYSHGIPQGPIASNFLSEVFMLPIDVQMAREFHYIRYVDDIRLFGRTQQEVRKAAIRLEIHCRQRGLIPHGEKYGVFLAGSEREALGMLPSVPAPDDEDEHPVLIDAREAVHLFGKSLKRRPLRIVDKTRARHVLFRAKSSTRLRSYVLQLLPRQPEHIDAFMYYLGHHGRSPKLITVAKDCLRNSPYEYVQGEMWHLLARMLKPTEMRHLVRVCADALKDTNAGFCLKWGAAHFACAAEKSGLGKYSRLLQFQSSLLQALVVPILPDGRYRAGDSVVRSFLRRSDYSPGIAIAQELVRRKLTHRHFRIRATSMASQVQNVFHAIGLIRRRSGIVDPVGEILARRFRVSKWREWRSLLGPQYDHASQILAVGDPIFASGRSEWLNHQNSFNQVVFLAIQDLLRRRGLKGAIRTRHSSGKLMNYGSTLDPNNAFSKRYPVVANSFRAANQRRNRLPGCHPYEKTGGSENRFLTVKERDVLLTKLSRAYEHIISSFGKYL
jgi:hypothetical protein